MVDRKPDSVYETIHLGHQSLSGSSGTPTRNFEISTYRAGTTLHSNKDLAVSSPFSIPMTELSLLRWDWAFLRLSPRDVSARTSMLTHGGRYPLFFPSLAARDECPDFPLFIC